MMPRNLRGGSPTFGEGAVAQAASPERCGGKVVVAAGAVTRRRVRGSAFGLGDSFLWEFIGRRALPSGHTAQGR